MNIIEFKQKGLEQTFKQIKRLKDAGENLNPLWLEFLKQFKNFEAANWQEQGRPFGVRWKGLSPMYKKWKQKQGKGGKANLILTGKLKKAASGGSGWYQIINKKEIKFGIDTKKIPYAAVHQFGNLKKNLPARQYFATPNGTLPGKLYQLFKELVKQKIERSKKI